MHKAAVPYQNLNPNPNLHPHQRPWLQNYTLTCNCN